MGGYAGVRGEVVLIESGGEKWLLGSGLVGYEWRVVREFDGMSEVGRGEVEEEGDRKVYCDQGAAWLPQEQLRDSIDSRELGASWEVHKYPRLSCHLSPTHLLFSLFLYIPFMDLACHPAVTCIPTRCVSFQLDAAPVPRE